MIDVLLIDTGTVRNEYSEPIGVETLVSYIQNACVRVTSIELYGYDVVLEDINRHSYTIIGISSKIGSFPIIQRLIEQIQQTAPNIVICIGDIYGTYAYEEILNWNPRLICMIGEGEKSLPALIDVVGKYGEEYRAYLPYIKSIAYFDGGIRVNERESVVNVRQAHSPSRLLLPDIIKRNGIAHLEGSRGCIYGKCSFCGIVQKYGNPEWRPFDEDYILNELISLSNAGIHSPYFTDEDFFGNDVERVLRIADGILALKQSGQIVQDLNFYFNMRIDSVIGNGVMGGYEKSRLALARLKEAGLREVFIGVESGSSKQINRYNKNNPQYKSMRAVMTLNSLAIDTDVGFILFDPFMTIHDLAENLNFIDQAGLTSNYSRLAKKLRVEPLTPFAQLQCDSDIISRELDMDLVSYPYTFQDQRVGRLYRTFASWEKEDLDFIYNLQSLCRGEVPSEELRKNIKQIISAYRSLDLALLKSLCDCELHGSVEQYKGILEHYHQIRVQYDIAMEGTVTDYISRYRS